MLNISQDAVLRTQVPVPPLPLQEKFDRIAWSVMGIVRQSSRTETRLESTWSELLKRAFSGELTAKWREAHMKELLAEMELQAHQLNLPMPQEAAV
jgi:type I restriction enzyme S subunit